MVIVCAVLSIICGMVSFWQGLVLMGFAQGSGETANYAVELEEAFMSVLICCSSVLGLLGAFGAIERRWWSWLMMTVSSIAVLISLIVGAIFVHDLWPTLKSDLKRPPSTARYRRSRSAVPSIAARAARTQPGSRKS